MRIDRLKRPALALSVLLLSGGAPARAQDTLEAPSAAVAAPVTKAAAAPTGDRIAFKGMTVPRGQRVEGDVVAPFGGVRVDGEVMGSVTVGSGDLVLGPEGTIHGDAVVNGGGKLIDEGGRILGEMRVSGGPSGAPAAERGAG
ncbi:MAG TPA: polymer-forming cytoskeletal protein, partial [Longimicrobium sp.]|nr:polymer-forming cytoskeletal protein [Longimicrobium sp.]